MKLKNTIIASALLSLTALSAQAAQELTPEKAAALKPFDRITITGRFNAINEAADAISRRADKLGADSFYIQDSNNSNNGGNWRVTADLYHKDAPEVSKDPKYRVINGVTELPKEQAFLLEPYDTVSVSGFYRSQPDINDAITKEAKKKGAASFFIVRQVDANQGGNQFITAYIYKADAPKRTVQSPDAIPADSEAGKAALAAGGAAAAKVEIPGVASSGSPSRDVGRFFETQSSTGKRYTVTLPNGTQIQEVNNVTAAQMVPFDSVTFTGHFNSMTDVSSEVAKRAAEKGAKYYHVTRQWQNKSGGNLTVSADLFK
ncbi:putative biofilm stress and motility protein A [Serratia quinivorans]|jgi:hypothetical protein|uniref:DUF1471 family protein YdgH n=2 Tax=Serratia TaxID=613 RepID=A0ABV3UHJ9_9GAMM|nr:MULTISPECIES: DUF1471 family protein YdgH [Serratia]MBV6691525.1 DUF1471 domain-containing protein [Serratia quinivorans]QGH63614.1 DUF1471 domain-containing protein [Serratia proteamaculans]CAI0692987.1 putative biofilm stress and motility protein A [Serratia quinivorans]CAI1610266.1 putative biofilm stress and motility protein A [Serratia quinivorans]CAI1651096.1 putative biofilm stress and motility protein A [Serratia quinivorans]